MVQLHTAEISINPEDIHGILIMQLKKWVPHLRVKLA